MTKYIAFDWISSLPSPVVYFNYKRNGCTTRCILFRHSRHLVRTSDTTRRTRRRDARFSISLRSACNARTLAIDKGESCTSEGGATVHEDKCAINALSEGATNAGVFTSIARAAGGERRKLCVELLSCLAVGERERGSRPARGS